MMSAGLTLKIHDGDTVAVALTAISQGDKVEVGGRTIEAHDEIPAGHKIALVDHALGCNVVKYGHPIGQVTEYVRAGGWIHSHNMKTNLSGKLEYEYRPNLTPNPNRNPMTFDATSKDLPSLPLTIDGYVRENGDVGIRNEIWILNTVGCINKATERLAREADKRFRGNGIDGVHFFSHPYGCSQLGDDLQYTQKVLAGLARHPNAAGILILGLGCENNHLGVFRPVLGEQNENRIKFLATQGVEDEFEAGMVLIEELVDYARTFKRQPVPVSTLRLGLKCGGSDGFSGITGNPLVGAVSDLLVDCGGTTLLTEVPEMFGAETILMNRARNEYVFQDIVRLINDFKDYYVRHGQVIYENPSPGNKDGGITTLEEKSLGCTQKGGTSPVSAVLQYGEAVRDAGLNLVQSPGNDMVSVTAMIAAGAHIVLFTTGRGTPMGGAVPTVKISTNTELAQRKKNWIDFDAGALIRGVDMHHVRDELFRFIVDVASGRKQTRNEQNDYREIAIFKDGVTL